MRAGVSLRTAAERRPPAAASAGPYNNNTPLVTPTPDGTGYATHVDVVYRESGIAGYKYVMVMTPYANLENAKENPSILVSQDNVTWTVPPGVTNPLIPAPAGTDYNSDPDILLANDGRVYIYYRTSVVNTGDRISYISSADLINWTAPIAVLNQPADTCLSPTVDFDGVNYRMYCVNGSTGVTVRFSGGPAGPWSAPRSISMPGIVPWHMDLSVLRGRYVMTLNEPNGSASKHIRIATSRDGINFTVGPRLITHAAQSVGGTIYRGCTDISADGSTYRIWYSTLSATCRIFYTTIPVMEMP